MIRSLNLALMSVILTISNGFASDLPKIVNKPSSKKASEPGANKIAEKGSSTSNKASGQPMAAAKSEVQVETKMETKAEVKANAQPESKTAAESKAELKSQSKGFKKPDTKTTSKTDTNITTKAHVAKKTFNSALVPPPPPETPSLMGIPDGGFSDLSSFEFMSLDAMKDRQRQLNTQLSDAQLDFKTRQNDAEEIKGKAKQFEALYSEGVISKRELENAQKEAAEVDSRISRAKVRVEDIESNISRLNERLKEQEKRVAKDKKNSTNSRNKIAAKKSSPVLTTKIEKKLETKTEAVSASESKIEKHQSNPLSDASKAKDADKAIKTGKADLAPKAKATLLAPAKLEEKSPANPENEL